MKKIVIYIRISTRERAINGYGLDAQETKAIEYIKLYENYDESKIIIIKDDGYSAKNMNRPGMKRLTKMIQDNEVESIIIYKLDRLSRNVINVYEFIKMVMDHGCNLISVVDQIDIKSANGRLVVGILALIAQWERETIIERTKDAIHQMAVEGRYPYPGTPFGYRKDKKCILSIDEEEQKYFKLAIDYGKRGCSAEETWRKLKEHGIKKELTQGATFVKKLWSNRIYLGELVVGGEVFYNVVPKLYDEEEYREISYMLKKRYKENHNERYYFGYKVHCTCGEICECVSSKKVLADRSIKRYYYYQCPNCKQRINQDELLEDVLYRIVRHEITETKKKEQKVKISNMKKINKNINDLYEKYEREEIDFKNYIFTLGKLNETKEKLKIELECRPSNEWENMNDKQRRVYIHEYVEKVVIDMTLKQVVKVTLI